MMLLYWVGSLNLRQKGGGRGVLWERREEFPSWSEEVTMVARRDKEGEENGNGFSAPLFQFHFHLFPCLFLIHHLSPCCPFTPCLFYTMFIFEIHFMQQPLQARTARRAVEQWLALTRSLWWIGNLSSMTLPLTPCKLCYVEDSVTRCWITSYGWCGSYASLFFVMYMLLNMVKV